MAKSGTFIGGSANTYREGAKRRKSNQNKKKESVVLNGIPAADQFLDNEQAEEVARSRGFSSAAEEQQYAKRNPTLYAVTGGKKYQDKGYAALNNPDSVVTPKNITKKGNADYNVLSTVSDRMNSTDINGIVKKLQKGEWASSKTYDNYLSKIKQYKNDYEVASIYSGEDKKSRNKTLNYLDTLTDVATKQKDTFSPYKSKKEYETAQKYKYAAAQQKENKRAALFKDITGQSDKTTNEKSDKTYLPIKGETVKSLSEYLDKNKPVSTYEAGEWYKSNVESQDNYNRTYMPREKLTEVIANEERAKELSGIRSGAAAQPDTQRIIDLKKSYWDTYTDEPDFENTKILSKYKSAYRTEKSQKILSYLDKKGLTSELEKYKSFLKTNEDKARVLYDLEQRKDVYSQDAFKAAEDSLASVPANLAGGLLAEGSNIVQGLANEAGKGDGEINVYDKWHSLANYAINVRSAVTENIDSKLGQFAYQTGMSMADSAVTMAFAAGLGALGVSTSTASAISAIPMSSAAANMTTRSMLEEGYTPTQAFRMGLASGFAEWMTEQIGIENMLKNMNGSSMKAALNSVKKQFIAEGMEEVASNVLNRLFEGAILGSESHDNKALQYYKSQGLSDKDALIKVLQNNLYDDITAFLGGAISGGVMGAGGAAFNYVSSTNAIGKTAISNGTEGAIIDLALSLPTNSEAYKYAANLNNEVTQRQIGKTALLVRDYINAVKTDEIYNAVYNRAIELGATKSQAKTIAEYKVGVETQQFTSTEEFVKSLKAATASRAGAIIIDEFHGTNDNARQWVSSLNNSLSAIEVVEEKLNNALDQSGETNTTLPENNVNNTVELPENNVSNTVSPAGVTPSIRTAVNVDTGENITFFDNPIQSIAEGKVTYKLASGKTIDGSKIQFSSDEQGYLFDGITTIDGITPAAANSFIKEYDGTMPVTDYVLGMAEGYQYGRANYPQSEIKGEYYIQLSPVQQNTAYKMGQIFADESTVNAQERTEDTYIEPGENEIDTTGYADISDTGETVYVEPTTKEQKSVVRAGKKFGTKVLFADLGSRAGDGYYKVGTNEIVIDKNADPVKALLVHELTHFAKSEGNTKAWDRFIKICKKTDIFKDYINNYVCETQENQDKLKGAKGIEAKIRVIAKDRMQFYADNGADISYDVAVEEVYSKFCGDTLFGEDSEKALENIIKYADRQEQKAVARFLNKLKAWIQKVFGKSDELNKITRLEREWLKLVKQAGENYAVKEDVEEGGKRYDIGVLENGDVYTDYNKPITVNDVETLRSIGKKSVKDFTSEDIKKAQKWAYKFYKELGTRSPFFCAWFGDWRAKDTVHKYNFVIENNSNKKFSAGKAVNKDTGKQISWGNHIKGETINHAVKEKVSINALNDIEQIVENSILFDTVVSNKTGKNKIANTAFMHSFYTVYISNGNLELLKLYVEEALSNNETEVFSRAYQLKDIQKIADVPDGVLSNIGGLTDDTSTKDSISHLYSLVNQYDKDFKPGKSVNVAFLNDDKTPRIFYHGTDANFTVFDRTKGRSTMDIQGMFFSPWEIDAAGYGKIVGKYYLSIQNPAPEGVAYKALNMFKGQNAAGIKARDYLVSLGYDGVNNSDEEIIAFYPEQVKSATDNIGTFDKNNPDIRFSISSENIRYNPDKYTHWLLRHFGLPSGETTVEYYSPQIQEIVKLFNKGGDNAITAQEKLHALALDMADTLQGNLTPWSQEIVDYVKGTKVSLTTTQEEEVRNQFKNLREFANRTGITVSQNANTTLDEQWEEWAGQYPEWFTPDTSEGDQVTRLVEIMDAVKSDYELLDTESLAAQIEEQITYNINDSGKANRNRMIREARKETGEKVSEEYRQKAREQREKRKQTEIRNKIKTLHKKISGMILSPTDNSYVPQDLLSAVADALSAVDIRNGKTNKTQEALTKLYDRYQALQDNADEEIKASYDNDLAEDIRQFKEFMQSRNVYDESLSSDMLTDIYDFAKAVYGTVMEAKRLIGENEKMAIRESGNKIISEQDNIYDMRSDSKIKELVKFLDDKSSLFYLNTLRAVLKMSGMNKNAELVRLFGELNNGLKKKYDFLMTENKKLDALIKTKEGQKAYDSAANDVIDFGWGKLTKMQAAQVLLTLYREKAIGTRHLETGGITVTNPKYNNNISKRRETKNTKTYQFSDIDTVINDIIKVFENDEFTQKYMAIARSIFRDTKTEINRASQILKHRDIAYGDKYIPFVTDKSFTVKEIEALVNNATIEGRGFTKKTTAGATNALYIEGLDVVLEDAIKNAADYSGLAVPIRNINKALNVKNDAEGKSVKNSIQKNWGSQGLKVITQALTDLQKSREADSLAIIDTLKAAFITSTLNGNISVAIKQAASLDTAFAVLNWRPSAVVWTEFAKTVKNYDSIIDEIDEHTSEHWRRRIGLTTDEIATMKQNSGFFGRMSRKIPAAFNGNKWIQMIDCWTTATFWNMAKQDINKAIKNGELSVELGSDEYWNKVTKLYEETIESTQPMYDTLHRSEMQKNNASNKLFMFKTQPLQNAGMLYEAVHGLAAAKASKDSTQKKKAALKLSKVLYSQARSAITFSLMTMLATAIKAKMKRYKDEEDELTLESLLKRFGLDVGSTASGLLFPIAGAEIYNWLDSVFISNNGFTVKSLVSYPVVDFINKYASAVEKVCREASIKNIANLLVKIGDLTGQPASNYYNLIHGIGYNFVYIKNGEFGQFKASEQTSSASKSPERDNYLDNIYSGKTKDAEKSYNAWIEVKKKEIADKREKDGKIELTDDELTESAIKGIKNSITTKLRADYQEAYKAKDEATMKKIRKAMTHITQFGATNDILETYTRWVKELKPPK